MPGSRTGSMWRTKGDFWSLGYHTGQDFIAPIGTPVVASRAGIVVESAQPTSWGPSYGNAVIIDDEQGTHHLYAHLSARHVRAGDHVRAGQRVGSCGTTGHSTGPHLHYETRNTADGLGFGADCDPWPHINHNLGGDIMHRTMRNAETRTIPPETALCVVWAQRSWKTGAGVSLAVDAPALVAADASIGLSSRPDWVRVSRWVKNGDDFALSGVLGAAQDVPDMGRAVYSFSTQGPVAADEFLRLEIKAAGTPITVLAGTGLLSVLSWQVNPT